MRCVLQFSVVPMLLGLLASQADARSGSGGFSGGIVIGASAAHISRQFIARRPVLPAQRIRASNLQRLHQRSLAQNGIPIGGIWPGFGWPDATQAVAAPAIDATAQPQPEVIIMHSDTAAHTASEPPPDFGYIPGCHAIPNGYHCDTPAQ